MIHVVNLADKSFNPNKARICSRHFAEVCIKYAWMTSSEAAKTCQEIASCIPDMANIDKSNRNEVCDAMRGMLTCFKEAMADCHAKHPDMIEQQKSAIQSIMNQLKSLINENCGSGAAGTATVSLGLLLVAFLASLF